MRSSSCTSHDMHMQNHSGPPVFRVNISHGMKKQLPVFFMTCTCTIPRDQQCSGQRPLSEQSSHGTFAPCSCSSTGRPGVSCTQLRAMQAYSNDTVWSPAKQTVKVLATDNICESVISHGKRQLRRMNLLGRSSPRMFHIDVLASRRLHRSPGFCTVLSSLSTYHNARAGQLGCLPQDFGLPAKDSSWL